MSTELVAGAAHCAPHQHARALSLLLEYTDVCTTVLSCRGEDRVFLKKATRDANAAGCSPSAPSREVWRLQSLFGAVRRTYAALLLLHPALLSCKRQTIRVP